MVQRELTLKSSFPEFLTLHERSIPIHVFRSPRARRYLLRLNADFSVRLTVPRRGSLAEAHAFLQRNIDWLERSAQRLVKRPILPKQWTPGTQIHWLGELVALEENSETRVIRFADQTVLIKEGEELRGAIERHIWQLAAKELPPIVAHYAALYGLKVRRVSVRNQRSRWGSCSRRGVISLNWRILQAPQFVRDYLILHELMHLREMNHSRRFWAHVANACPEYKTADRWLSQHSHLLAR
jgi:predicted metal-dependent hydrolase